MLVDAITEHEPAAGWSPSRTSPSTKSSFRGTFPGAPLMPAVLMLESLSQVAAILLLSAGAAVRADARLPARRQRRQVPPAGRAGRSAAPRDLARPAARSAGRARRRSAFVGDQVVAECELLLGLAADGRRHRSDGDRASVRRGRRGHEHRAARRRSARTSGSGRTAGSAPRRSSTAGPRSATTPRSIRSRRSASSRRTSSSAASRRGSSSASATSSASSSRSIAARAAAAA